MTQKAIKHFVHLRLFSQYVLVNSDKGWRGRGGGANRYRDREKKRQTDRDREKESDTERERQREREGQAGEDRLRQRQKIKTDTLTSQKTVTLPADPQRKDLNVERVLPEEAIVFSSPNFAYLS